MEEFIHFNLFYVFLFTFLIIVVIAICGTIKFLNGNTTHKGIVENIKDIFFKSSDNAKEVTIDTTSKMENMHTKVVDGIPEVYHQELHSLEVSVKSLTDITIEINQKLDILMAQVIKTRKVIDINSKKHN